MTLFIEELTLLRQKLSAPMPTHLFESSYDIAYENNIRHVIIACLDRYQENADVVRLFKDISNIMDNDVKYLAARDNETDAYLPLLLTLREKLVVSLIRELNLTLRDGHEGTLLLQELAAIYHYLQTHFKNPDWFANPEAYESTRISNFKILAEIDEQSWADQVRINSHDVSAGSQ